MCDVTSDGDVAIWLRHSGMKESLFAHCLRFNSPLSFLCGDRPSTIDNGHEKMIPTTSFVALPRTFYITTEGSKLQTATRYCLFPVGENRIQARREFTGSDRNKS